MISALWLLIIIPVGWFMFFLGVAMCSNAMDDEIKKREKRGKPKNIDKELVAWFERHNKYDGE